MKMYRSDIVLAILFLLGIGYCGMVCYADHNKANQYYIYTYQWIDVDMKGYVHEYPKQSGVVLGKAGVLPTQEEIRSLITQKEVDRGTYTRPWALVCLIDKIQGVTEKEVEALTTLKIPFKALYPDKP